MHGQLPTKALSGTDLGMVRSEPPSSDNESSCRETDDAILSGIALERIL